LANGAREIANGLSKDVENVHLSSPITSITADPDASHSASLTCMIASGEKKTINGFHHIIFATEAETAASILRGFVSSLPNSADLKTFNGHLQQQIQVLRKFQYRKVVVVNHTDRSLLPDDTRDRRELNLIYHRGGEPGIFEEGPDRDSSVCVPSSYAMVTHILPRPKEYPADQPTIYQSTNPYIPPRKDSILSSSELQRAIPTVEARKALQGLCQEDGRRWWECPAVCKTKLGPLQGAGRMLDGSHPGVWICGSYAFPGIPFLEGCVVSAKNVVVQGILKCENTSLQEEPWMA
jgi:microfibrillar-associated protein 1